MCLWLAALRKTEATTIAAGVFQLTFYREGFSFQGVSVLLCVCVSLLLLICALLCFSAPICGYISPGMKRREAALLLVSAAVLAYQVLLMRAFSIGQWHHFAYMVISIALLGFGASGTLLAVLQRRHEPRRAKPPRPRRWRRLVCSLRHAVRAGSAGFVRGGAEDSF